MPNLSGYVGRDAGGGRGRHTAVAHARRGRAHAPSPSPVPSPPGWALGGWQACARAEPSSSVLRLRPRAQCARSEAAEAASEDRER